MTDRVAIEHIEQARANLEAELVQVEQQLRSAIAELFPPFSQMVATQLRHSYPLQRAAIVLTAGVGEPDRESIREQRIFLAAALEMLHLAINVHMMLSDSPAGETPNRSLLGSTVLAGDYCFSRSAGLAVRTGDPIVVEIFSDALKRVSEGHLRQFFDSNAQAYNENRELFVAGVAAAMQLSGATEQARVRASKLAEALASAILVEEQKAALHALGAELSLGQSARWFALADWRQTQ